MILIGYQFYGVYSLELDVINEKIKTHNAQQATRECVNLLKIEPFEAVNKTNKERADEDIKDNNSSHLIIGTDWM